jgi:DNA-binding NtrC family response regulator
MTLADTKKRLSGSELAVAQSGTPQPGLALIFADGQPILRVLPMADGVLEVGREHPALLGVADPLMSRRHVKVTHDGTAFIATDQGSSNGTTVDGMPVPAHTPQLMHLGMRLGDSLFIPVADVRPLQRWGIRQDSQRVLGPAMQQLLRTVGHSTQQGCSLHITGESGSGKEGVARAFHDSGPNSKGRFIAVNCATIPEGLAERLLFGAKRGAYSGAEADADGYLQAADGGTLFLDEVAELGLPVQAKLLRVIENREVLPVGATRTRPVSLRLCTATHKNLRAQVTAGRLREDLFYRIATPEVLVPPLRERMEELPWLLHMAAQGIAPGLQLDASLVEACLQRTWPGNVRELLSETRSATQAALAETSPRLEARHLSLLAGMGMATPPPAEPTARKRMPNSAELKPQDSSEPDRATIEDVLRRTNGNITATARLLNVHRTQLYRWLSRFGILVAREGKPAAR